MKKIKQQHQCPLGYRVGVDKNSKRYEQIINAPGNPLPMEFWCTSPLDARIDAGIFMEGGVDEVRVFKPHDLEIYLIDLIDAKEYLIYNGQGATKEILKNLAFEYELYKQRGYYPYKGSLMTDEDGKSYRVILNPFIILQYDEV
jgi:hypothetical protein